MNHPNGSFIDYRNPLDIPLNSKTHKQVYSAESRFHKSTNKSTAPSDIFETHMKI